MKQKHIVLMTLLVGSVLLAGCTESDLGSATSGGDKGCRFNDNAKCVAPSNCDSGDANGFTCKASPWKTCCPHSQISSGTAGGGPGGSIR